MAAPVRDARDLAELSLRSRMPPLLTDLYQFTMAYAYWRAGRHDEPAAFEMFFRQAPFGGGFSLFAGLSDCLLFLRNFRLTEDDVAYLQSVLPQDTDPAFFSFLTGLDCSAVSIASVPEGTAMFGKVPLLEVSGPLAVVQLLETSLLCMVNYASLVCSNAARFRLAAGPAVKLMELGLRRAQGPDGGLSASRYTHIGGFDLTSNVLAGRLFGVPVAGTMAHSYITSFSSLEETLMPCSGGDPVDLVSLAVGWLRRVRQLLGAESGGIRQGEFAAFLSYGIAYPQNFLPVIDSYSVQCSGLPCFCAVALALCELGYRPVGIRLDSGDLCRQSVEVRGVFRRCSDHFNFPEFQSLIIVGSNGVSEGSLAELRQKENEINVMGVGTHLVTCSRQPSLGCVYKLVEISGQPRMKLTEDPKKSTLPGRKAVYRLMDSDGRPFLDLLCLSGEPEPKKGVSLRCHPLGQEPPLCVTPAQVMNLQQKVFINGQIICPLSSLGESRARAQTSINALHPQYTRLEQPDKYPVCTAHTHTHTFTLFYTNTPSVTFRHFCFYRLPFLRSSTNYSVTSKQEASAPSCCLAENLSPRRGFGKYH
ncbi:nicotinate phosphoribosyltransferase-like isoform X2 [Denticeps clupeoides]|uniref:nicotinate phosphoribosyltransferase-like isoform X2 n=1 Tax=Denticeps clupeoides TaxID=299321 RepID=UPI0010A2ADB9|nr:nicotinate phosphoribosyltransferase-like isoform X2 [Denticeps clupeoides]